MTAGDQCSKEQSAADGLSATADEALAAPLAGLASPGSQAGESCDLAAIERTELRQLSDQRAGDDGPDAGNGGEQILLFRPDRRATHLIVDRTVEFGQFLFHGLAQPCDAFAQAFVGQAALALAFCRHHLDDLPPAGNEVGQKPCLVIWQGTRLRLGSFGKVSNQAACHRAGHFGPDPLARTSPD